jgi:RimJ/RimL family protein N-acetyltransferase
MTPCTNIRLLRPVDEDVVRAVFDGLGDESRYYRFLNAKPRLSAGDLRALTAVDGVDHVALFVEAGTNGEPVAIGRFVRGDDDEAELAIAVVDEWQGRGIGGCLLDRLISLAGAAGVTRLNALTAAGNAPMLALLERRGFKLSGRAGAHVELDLIAA